MLWVLIRTLDSNEYPQHMFLWRTDEDYTSIIIRYPLYLHPAKTQIRLGIGCLPGGALGP